MRSVNIDRLQRKLVLLVAAVVLLVAALFLQPRWTTTSVLHESMIWIGAFLIGAAICGRTWAIVHIGGRKTWHFISEGPYSVARHPLYAFSILGTAGMAAQTTSFVVTLTAVFVVWVIFARAARVEETDMTARFGDIYRSYLARTPRFFPKPSLWRPSSNGIAVDYPVAIRSFADSSLFAVAVPFYLALRWAHDAQLIPVLYELP
jgi:protein-S-isoprenylcysteine O-methyltransferase Ste14